MQGSVIVRTATFAALSMLVGVVQAAGSRSLFWTYPAESTAYETPANWAVGSSTGDPATESPNGADTVRFLRGSCTKTSDNTVVLSADTFVSNFEYRVEGDAGKLTLDLNGHDLCVSNNASISTRAYAPNSLLTIKDGTMRVIGTHKGGTSWGQPNEDYGGFYINRPNSQNMGCSLTVDNATIINDTMLGAAWKWNSLQGYQHYLTFTNGAHWVSSNLNVYATSGTHIRFSGKNTLCSVEDGKFSTGSDSRFNATVDAGADRTFNDGARLVTGIFSPAGGGTYLFDGGVHELWGVSEGATRGAMICSARVILTNGATFATSKKADNHGINLCGTSCLTVSENCAVTSCVQNVSISVGAYPEKTGNGPLGATLELDGGRVEMPWVTFGAATGSSNTVLRIKGPRSLVKQTQDSEWGSARFMKFSFGTQIEFEIPDEGYHDANGTPRAPIYATGCFGSETNAIAKPIGLKLAHRVFDKAHPQETLTLMQATKVTDGKAGHDTRAFYAKLLENVTWENSYHGELTVSEDGKKLLYTAPPKRGLALLVR